MSKKRKWVPDHYQTDPGAKISGDLYKDEMRKLGKGEAPALKPGHPGVGELIHAGQPLMQPVAAVCVECEEEVGFAGGAPVTPCRSCGSVTFRVKS